MSASLARRAFLARTAAAIAMQAGTPVLSANAAPVFPPPAPALPFEESCDGMIARGVRCEVPVDGCDSIEMAITEDVYADADAGAVFVTFDAGRGALDTTMACTLTTAELDQLVASLLSLRDQARARGILPAGGVR